MPSGRAALGAGPVRCRAGQRSRRRSRWYRPGGASARPGRIGAGRGSLGPAATPRSWAPSRPHAAADSGTIGGLPDRGASVRMCRTALTEAGLPAGGDAASLAAAVRAERPGLRAALVAALDDWINSLQFPPDPDAARVRAAVDLVDPDPFRSEVRAAVARGDKQRCSGLAGRPDATNLPLSSAVMLGEALHHTGDYAAVRPRAPGGARPLSIGPPAPVLPDGSLEPGEPQRPGRHRGGRRLRTDCGGRPSR